MNAPARRRVGRCELFHLLGSGGMASVHIGRMLGAGDFARPVAIKQLHQQYGRDEQFKQMFLNEARVVARIRHPNVVPTIDLLEDGDEMFIVMELIEGVTLKELLKLAIDDGTVIPVGVALRILHGVLSGLHAAHEAKDKDGQTLGLVHRDVSPDNILVGVDGYARVFDFGIAKALGTIGTTRQGEVKGKVPYMTPEQIAGDPVDRTADVFAASVVMWEMLTCSRLFRADDIGETLHRVLHMEVPPPSSQAPHVPPAVDALVLRGIERDRSRRVDSAEALAAQIESLGLMAPASEVGEWVRDLAADPLDAALHIVAQMEATPPVEGFPDATGAQPPVVLSEPAPQSSLVPMVGAAVLAAAIVGAGVFFAMRGEDEVVTAPATTTTVKSAAPAVSSAPAPSAAPTASASAAPTASASASVAAAPPPPPAIVPYPFKRRPVTRPKPGGIYTMD